VAIDRPDEDPEEIYTRPMIAGIVERPAEWTRHREDLELLLS